MSGLFGLKGPVAHNLAVDEGDTVNTKKALSQLGHYELPKWGVTPYPDTEMFDGLKSFQRSQGLAVDGLMKKDGPTARLLDAALWERGARGTGKKAASGAGGRPILSLRGAIGGDARARPRDVQTAKRALAWAGVYPPEGAQAPTGEADPALDSAIRVFQDRYNLKRDGLMRPNGPTARMLNRAIRPAVTAHLERKAFNPRPGAPIGKPLGTVRPFDPAEVILLSDIMRSAAERGGEGAAENKQDGASSPADIGSEGLEIPDIFGENPPDRREKGGAKGGKPGERGTRRRSPGEIRPVDDIFGDGLDEVDDQDIFGENPPDRREKGGAKGGKPGERGTRRRPPGEIRSVDDIFGDGPDEVDDQDIFGENPPDRREKGGAKGGKPGERGTRRRPPGEIRPLDDIFGDSPDEVDDQDIFGENPPADATDGLTADQRVSLDERLGGRRLHSAFGDGRVREEYLKATEANPERMNSIQKRMIVADELTPAQVRELRKDIAKLDLSGLGGGESGFRRRLNTRVTRNIEITSVDNMRTRSVPEINKLKEKLEKFREAVEMLGNLSQRAEIPAKIFAQILKGAENEVMNEINRRPKKGE